MLLYVKNISVLIFCPTFCSLASKSLAMDNWYKKTAATAPLLSKCYWSNLFALYFHCCGLLIISCHFNRHGKKGIRYRKILFDTFITQFCLHAPSCIVYLTQVIVPILHVPREKNIYQETKSKSGRRGKKNSQEKKQHVKCSFYFHWKSVPVSVNTEKKP